MKYYLCLFFIFSIYCGCIKENGDSLHVSFIFLPLKGHINPILGLAEELGYQGCFVTFLIPETKKEWVNKEGIYPLSIKLTDNEQDDISLSTRSKVSNREQGFIGFIKNLSQMFRSNVVVEFANIQRPLIRYALEEYKKGNYNPDIIITEKHCMVGSDISEYLDIPVVFFQPSLIHDGLYYHYVPAFSSGLPVNMTYSQRFINKIIGSIPLNLILSIFGGPLFELREEMNIHNIVSPYLPINRNDAFEIVATCFGFEYPRPIYPTTKLVGPLIPKQYIPIPNNIVEWIESESSDVIYMCMGTAATITNDMVKIILDGLKDKEYRILWSLPKTQLGVLEGLTLPSNFHLEYFVPQRELLMHKKVKGFYSHTGASSTNEAILAEVPVVCMPFFGDQYDYCQRLVYLKAGIFVDKTSFTSEEIANNIHLILYNKIYKDNIKKAKLLLQCGSTSSAADIVFVSTNIK